MNARSTLVPAASVFALLVSLVALSGCGPATRPPSPGAIQERPDYGQLDRFLGEVNQEGSGSVDEDELLYELAAFRDRPVDVNSAAPGDLLRVPFMDPASALRIAAEVERSGPVSSVDQLVFRGAMDERRLSLVRPYLVAHEPEASASVTEPDDTRGPAGDSEARRLSGTGDDTEPALRVDWELRARVSLRELSAGERDDLRDPVGTFARYCARIGERLIVAASCGKDPGESSYFDHTALAIDWTASRDNDGDARRSGWRSGLRLTRVSIGNLAGRWGQGLALGTGSFSSARGYPFLNGGLGGYSGASESTSRRGIAVSLRAWRAGITALAASTRLDAAINDDGLAGSVRTSGYHVTEGERAGRRALLERLVGVRVSVPTSDVFEVGATALSFEYSPGLAPGDPERQHFRPGGSALSVVGADLRVGNRNARLGTEVARNAAGGTAAVCAVRVSRGGGTARAGFARLSPEYTSPLGGTVPGCSSGHNGRSAWLVTSYRARSGWKLWAETTLRSRPWRSYHHELPDRASAIAAGGEFKLGRSSKLLVRLRRRAYTEEDGEQEVTVPESRSTMAVSLDCGGETPLRFDLKHIAASVWDVQMGRSTIVGLRVTRGVGVGCALTAGLTSVSREGDAPAVVQYEPGLPGEFSLRSLNSSGIRWYIRLRVLKFSALDVAVRLGGGPGRGRTEFGLGIDVRGDRNGWQRKKRS